MSQRRPGWARSRSRKSKGPSGGGKSSPRKAKKSAAGRGAPKKRAASSQKKKRAAARGKGAKAAKKASAIKKPAAVRRAAAEVEFDASDVGEVAVERQANGEGSGQSENTPPPASDEFTPVEGGMPPPANGHRLARIGVRPTGVRAFREFYDTRTRKPFLPRGNNLTRGADFFTPTVVEIRPGVTHAFSGILKYPHFDFTTRFAPFPGGPRAIGAPTTLSPGVGPGFYNPADIERQMNAMRRSGYNVVRVFFDNWYHAPGLADWPAGAPKLCTAYVNNAIDFIRRAERHGMHVVLSWGWLAETYYKPYAEAPLRRGNRMFDPEEYKPIDGICWHVDPNGEPDVQGDNVIFMHKGVVAGTSAYIRDVLKYMRGRAPDVMTAILGIELLNEPAFQRLAYGLDGQVVETKPFSMDSGEFRITLAGVNDGANVYDMGDEEDRKRLVRDATVYWLNEVAGPIEADRRFAKILIPGGAVYTPYSKQLSGYHGLPKFRDLAPGCNVPDPPAGCENALEPHRVKTYADHPLVDYIDIHLYPTPTISPTYDITEDLASAELVVEGGGRSKFTTPGAPDLNQPMNMGEFGAWDGTYPTIVEAVDVLLGQQVRSSEYGFFGWQFFTWDSEIAGGANRFWNAMDDGEQINIALAPAHRPDPDR